jgi:hypothetical protein
MLEVSENQKKASLILNKFGITEILTELLDKPYQFDSSASISLSQDVSKKEIQNLVKGVVLESGDQEMVFGVSDFRTTYMPDGDSTSHANAYLHFNGECVLETSAERTYLEWGAKSTVHDYPFSIKTFKAGPWLELLGKWHDGVKKAGDRRDELRREEQRAKRDKEEESKFDLGGYEDC